MGEGWAEAGSAWHMGIVVGDLRLLIKEPTQHSASQSPHLYEGDLFCSHVNGRETAALETPDQCNAATLLQDAQLLKGQKRVRQSLRPETETETETEKK